MRVWEPQGSATEAVAQVPWSWSESDLNGFRNRFTLCRTSPGRTFGRLRNGQPALVWRIVRDLGDAGEMDTDPQRTRRLPGLALLEAVDVY